MSEPSAEVKIDPVSIEGFEEVFDVSGSAGTDERTPKLLAGTSGNSDPGQPGHESIEATVLLTFISTSDAAKFAKVDSRTVRRWYEQKKVRGQLNKGKLLIAKEDLILPTNEPEFCSAGTPGAESGTEETPPGTQNSSSPGQPGQSTDIPQTPVMVFSDFLDRIERLSRENGELKIMLDQQVQENQQLKLLTDSQNKTGWWSRFCSWFKV